MSIKKLRSVLILALISTVIVGCVQPQSGGMRPSTNQFSSQWVDITMGGMTASSGTGLVLALNLANKSNKALEVSVSFKAPDPKQQCEIEKQIKNKGSTLFQCPQTSVTPNVDYPIAITIYTLGEQGEKQLVENANTKFHFSENDARGFEQLIKAMESVGQ
jgi:hypothetical protein